MKLGIFVGSFNPPTKAHFEISNIVYKSNLVDKVIFIPCNSLNKKNELINIKERINMLNLYTKDYDYLLVNDIEYRNGSKNFNYSNLDLIQKEYKEDTLYVIIGSDNFINFSKWDNYEYLLETYNFIIINRNNIDLDLIIKTKYNKYKNKFNIIEYNNTISSTLFRENKENDIIDNKVLKYIKENNLYK